MDSEVPPTPTVGSSLFVFFGKMFSLGCSELREKRAVERRLSEFWSRSEVGRWVGWWGGVGERGGDRERREV